MFSSSKKWPISAGVLLVVFVIFGIWRIVRQNDASELQGSLAETEQKLSEKEGDLAALEAQTAEEEAARVRERENLAAQEATEDATVEGVFISQASGKRTLRNEPEGYSLVIPEELILARSVKSDMIELHDRSLMCAGDPLCEPVIRIQLMESGIGQLTLEDWFTKQEKGAGSAMYSPREFKKIGEMMLARATEDIPRRFSGFYYYWEHGGRIYALRIAASDEEKLLPIIETLRVIGNE